MENHNFKKEVLLAYFGWLPDAVAGRGTTRWFVFGHKFLRIQKTIKFEYRYLKNNGYCATITGAKGRAIIEITLMASGCAL